MLQVVMRYVDGPGKIDFACSLRACVAAVVVGGEPGGADQHRKSHTS